MPSISADPQTHCQGTGPRWGSVGINGQEDKFFSESWLGALSGGMLDVLVFIESTDPSSEAVLSNYARQVAEIAPSFRGRPFGVQDASLTVNVTAVGAPTVPPHPGYSRIGGEEGFRLRAAVWEETAAAPAVICAHVVVTNLDLQNPLLFTFELGGRAPPASKEMLTVRRIFGPGAVANLTTNNGSRWLPVQAWLAPADTGIFQAGCTVSLANASNIAQPDVETPALRRTAGWSTPGFGGVDPLVSITSDTTVAKDGRHSARIRLPSAVPLVLAFPGKQLVPPPPLVHFGMNGTVKVPAGYPQVGNSITLLPGHTYSVSLAVQATPPGTTVELMGGMWRIEQLLVKEMEPNVRANYSGTTLGKVVVAAGQGWQELTATVAVPAATPGVGNNGTALQLRITPPESERGLGATAWVDSASVVDVADLP